MRTLTGSAFARYIAAETDFPDPPSFAFFLGAGCSRSSGIPTAGELVRGYWLPRLHHREAPETKIDEWVAKDFEGYESARAAEYYGQVMDRLFLNAADRQREIERLCDGKDPKFGYAVLANLMASERHGHRCFNVAITTNFDDLLADALYLYSPVRPLVINHESLGTFIKPTRGRPLIVKVHGDHQLAPRNTPDETRKLDDRIVEPVHALLRGRIIVFVGYGGNDESIETFLKGLPLDSVDQGIYWVSSRKPTCRLTDWLAGSGAVWVQADDFDKLMVLVRDAFVLPHPSKERFDQLFSAYAGDYQKLSEEIRRLPATASDAEALKAAAERTDKSFPDWWSVELEASRLARHDLDAADETYRRGCEQFPTSAPLLGNYALFLDNARRGADRAKAIFERALALEPLNAIILSNFALLLVDELKDPILAKEMFERAMQTKPSDATSLGNCAAYLHRTREDLDLTEAMYERGLAADPNHENILGNYALFLDDLRKDPDRAEAMYERAIAADPSHLNNLDNYAQFLADVRQDPDRAEDMYERAVAAAPNNANALGSYALFLRHYRKDPDRAEAMYERALAADPGHANNLGNYAIFLQVDRGEPDRAEHMYGRAVAADPGHANSLGNYSGLLLATGRKEEGLSRLEGLLSRDDLNAWPGLASECWFYAFVHGPESDRDAALTSLKRFLVAGDRSPGWDLSAHVQCARQDEREDVDWIGKVAAVISDGLDVGELDGWDAWQSV